MPELQWKTEERDFGGTYEVAYHNGVKILELEHDFFKLFCPYEYRQDLRLKKCVWSNFGEAKEYIQQQFDTFYNKYKPLFEGEKT